MISRRRSRFIVKTQQRIRCRPAEHYFLVGGVWHLTTATAQAAPIRTVNPVLRAVRRSVWGAGPNPGADNA